MFNGGKQKDKASNKTTQATMTRQATRQRKLQRQGKTQGKPKTQGKGQVGKGLCKSKSNTTKQETRTTEDYKARHKGSNKDKTRHKTRHTTRQDLTRKDKAKRLTCSALRRPVLWFVVRGCQQKVAPT